MSPYIHRISFESAVLNSLQDYGMEQCDVQKLLSSSCNCLHFNYFVLFVDLVMQFQKNVTTMANAIYFYCIQDLLIPTVDCFKFCSVRITNIVCAINTYTYIAIT